MKEIDMKEYVEYRDFISLIGDCNYHNEDEFDIEGVHEIVIFEIFHIKEIICNQKGHIIEDCSSAGPDSGNMDHRCERCGEYWAVPLY